MSITCPSCSASAPSGTAFCAKCGAPLVSDEPPSSASELLSRTSAGSQSRPSVLRRVFALLTSPGAEWRRIALENRSAAQIFWGYGAILAVIDPLSWMLGTSIFGPESGHPIFDGVVRYAVMDLLVNLAFAYCALGLSRAFGVRANLRRAMKVTIYGQTTAFLLKLVGLNPDPSGVWLGAFGIFAAVAIVMTPILFRKGSMAVLEMPPRRALTFAIVLFVALIGLSVPAAFLFEGLKSGPRNPPLLPPGKPAQLSALQSPYAALGVSANTADDTVLTTYAVLQARLRRDAQAEAEIDWPVGLAAPSRFFSRFDHPSIRCPSAPSDGEACTLTFTPSKPTRSTTSGKPLTSMAVQKILTQLSPADLNAIDVESFDHTGVVIVRLDIDSGDTTYIRPRLDPSRRLLASGVDAPRIVYSSNAVAFGVLGSQTVVCRADAPPGAVWERRTCTIEFGPNQLSVGRDVYLPGAKVFQNAEDDPELMGYLQDASKFFTQVVGRDPVLERALAPIRAGNDADTMFENLVMPGAGQKDSTAEVRALVAKNAPLVPWHDVATQKEFELVCTEAASAGRPLLIYSTGMNDQQAVLYGDVFKLFSKAATLVLVRYGPPVGNNAWAEAFVDVTGAGQWPAITVSDKPHTAGSACQVGKVFQGQASELRPADVMSAILHGRPPAPATPPAKSR
jgi:hypothetical protein